MPIERMNREQFFGQLSALDEQRLKKALWNLYWRGSAATRERIEAEINPDQHDRGTRSREPADPHQVLQEVREHVTLARSGAYMAGDRRVSPRERTRWRLTFKRLVTDAQDGLRRGQDAAAAATAMELLIDLACEARDFEYFHSEDPMEAAGFVVSDAVALLWATLQAQRGFAGFAQRAAPQLIRWESRYGWTRSGWGRISQKETSLASVAAQMLPAFDAWVVFTDHYLHALDRLAGGAPARPNRSWPPTGRDRDRRTADLAQWHGLLLERLVGSEAEDRLDRLASHPALGGPELVFLKAQLAHQRGEAGTARNLVHAALQQLPGHKGFLDLHPRSARPSRLAPSRSSRNARPDPMAWVGWLVDALGATTWSARVRLRGVAARVGLRLNAGLDSQRPAGACHATDTTGPTLLYRDSLHPALAHRLYDQVPGTPAQLDPVAAALWDQAPCHLGLPLIIRGLAAWWRLHDPAALPHPPPVLAAGLAALTGRLAGAWHPVQVVAAALGVDPAEPPQPPTTCNSACASHPSSHGDRREPATAAS